MYRDITFYCQIAIQRAARAMELFVIVSFLLYITHSACGERLMGEVIVRQDVKICKCLKNQRHHNGEQLLTNVKIFNEMLMMMMSMVEKPTIPEENQAIIVSKALLRQRFPNFLFIRMHDFVMQHKYKWDNRQMNEYNSLLSKTKKLLSVLSFTCQRKTEEWPDDGGYRPVQSIDKLLVNDYDFLFLSYYHIKSVLHYRVLKQG